MSETEDRATSERLPAVEARIMKRERAFVVRSFTYYRQTDVKAQGSRPHSLSFSRVCSTSSLPAILTLYAAARLTDRVNCGGTSERERPTSL